MSIALPSRGRVPSLVARAPVAAVFCAAGTLHFVTPEPFVAIVPDWLPAPLLLTHLSGAAELAGGLGMLWARTARPASAWLIATLLAVFPANVGMALNAADHAHIPEALLWLRLPLQALLIAWVARAGGLLRARRRA